MRQFSRQFSRRYGAHPVHLLVMACCFAVAGYAAVQLLMGRTVAVAVWFIGAALLHDLLLVPVYSGVDRAARTALTPRRRRSGRGEASGRRIMCLRAPLALSALLFLVWFPLILRRPAPYHRDTGLSDSVYLGRWLLITAGLFAASALAALINTVRGRHRARPPATGSSEGHGR
ncbi:hypothetical protein [Streptomyces sp. NBC_00859]|uniref:hypothetical protein n=1 Tax=Streptomyces sp. NBC_00859 TaxID=2903682 RepID=UPI003868B3FF|nr:hypothetical protein OG584_14225 [Streptomyces sp. NBC_00859]